MQNPKSPNSITSSEIVASIDDVLTEILLLLPIKPLMRFKSVSKHWLSLITNHCFCLRRNPIPNPPTGFFLTMKNENQYSHNYIPLYPTQYPNPPPAFYLNFTTDPSKTKILHSCNGLFLCCSSKSWDGDRDILKCPDCSIYVFNPTTNLSVALPGYPSEWSPQGATLVFDPVKSPHYKVVLVVIVYLVERTCEIKVYSSETGRWSHGGELDGFRFVDVYRSGVYWNGSVHWLNSNLLEPRNSIRFHVDSQVVGEMLTPPAIEYKRVDNYYFGESCGHLHFAEHPLQRLDIYEMKMDYSEWFVKYQVDIMCIVDAFPEVMVPGIEVGYVGYVLSVIRGDDEEASLVLRIPGKAVRFSLVDGTSEKLFDFAQDKIQHRVHFPADENDFVGTVETYRFVDECGLDYIQSLYSC